VRNAPYGNHANTIPPGLMDTPMAVEYRVMRDGASREEVLTQRQAGTPLKVRMGSAWDVANSAVFLASDEASFMTGASLVVDGGQSLVAG